ncbi:NAD(P)/FAD-dependent oxidoreductase [Streptomyces sp. NPDC021622]|uniref:FAD-dependent oxidoreductase n=1 Tax=Streptomyces sp. NPDC021622 TaxID=3155013 RepID=UPI0033FF9309
MTNTRMPARRAVVVGAGPVGCLAAQILAARGYTVEVYEKRPHYVTSGLRYDGRTINLSLSPRGVDALDGKCSRAELAGLVVPMDSRARHGLDGEVSVAGYGRDDWQTLSIDRNDLNLLLMKNADAAPAVRFTFETECTGVDFGARRVSFVDRSGRARHADYDLLVGADGTHSAVRGHLAEQGLTQSRQQQVGAEYREVTILAEGGEGAEPRPSSAIHIWPRDGYFMVGLPNRDGSLRCTLVLPRDGALTFADLATDEAVLTLLRRDFPDEADRIRLAEPDPSRAPVSSISVVTCSPVVHDGSVLLLGDAAHTVAPFLGQGVNLGLEDCAVLERLLEKWPQDQGAVLAEFQRERVPEHEAASALSLANYVELSGTGPAPGRSDVPPLPALVNFVSPSYQEALDIYSGERRAPGAIAQQQPTGG